MSRKPRVEISSYYHIINRGVEQRDVFIDKDDFLTFSLGYSQQMIAEVIGISQQAVANIVKREKL
jgi:predicted DNA-binding protein (UPF0251 family)